MIYMDTLQVYIMAKHSDSIVRNTAYIDIPVLPCYTWIHCIHAGTHVYIKAIHSDNIHVVLNMAYMDIPVLPWYTWMYL